MAHLALHAHFRQQVPARWPFVSITVSCFQLLCIFSGVKVGLRYLLSYLTMPLVLAPVLLVAEPAVCSRTKYRQ